MRNKCNAFESSENSPPLPQSVEKLSSVKLVPGAKKAGDCWSMSFLTPSYRDISASLWVFSPVAMRIEPVSGTTGVL